MHCFLGGFRSCAECETGAESIELPDKIGRNRAYKLRHDGGLVENYCTSDFLHLERYSADIEEASCGEETEENMSWYICESSGCNCSM